MKTSYFHLLEQNNPGYYSNSVLIKYEPANYDEKIRNTIFKY